MTGTIKEYTPGTSVVLETLAPSEPIQFKLSKTVTYNGPDGKTLFTAGLDDSLRAWEVASGKELRRHALVKFQLPNRDSHIETRPSSSFL